MTMNMVVVVVVVVTDKVIADEVKRNAVRGVVRKRIGIERKGRSARRIESEKDTNGGVIVIEIMIEIVVGAVIVIVIMIGPTVPIDPNQNPDPKMRSQL